MHVRSVYARLLVIYAFLIAHSLFGQTNWLPPTQAHAPDSTKLWTLRHIGDSLVNAGQFSQAKQAYQQAMTLALSADDRNSIGLGYRSMGYWYEQVSDYPQAIAYYQRALAEFRRTNNARHLARTMYFISFCYDRLHDDNQALQYAKSGLAIAQKAGLHDSVVQIYQQLASLEAHRRQYKQADWYTSQILTYYKDRKDWMGYYAALFNSALSDKNRGAYGRAEGKFRQVETFALEHNDNYMLGYVQASIPYALIPQNKLEEAERYSRQALAWVEKTGTNKYSALVDINEHLSRIYEKRGDYKQALFYYKQQKANQDSVFNETKNRQLAELETRYQTRQKEDSINQLVATNAMQTRQIWAGTGGIIVLTILLGTLYGLYNRVRQSRRKIQQQSDQMALMMKELHHRVKNNLAIVSSLLKLQSNRLDDEKAVQAVRVGQQRVEAMALIHQRLYQTDSVTTVNMREYLTDLAGSLMRAYGYPPDDFDLELTIDQPELDVDVAMPLGLIVNELVTNSFKYAYAGAKRPLLRIALLSQVAKPGITLEVQDNGPGIDLADWQRSGNRSSFGKRLIASLSEQLDGHFDLYKQDGTLFRLQIPQVRLAA